MFKDSSEATLEIEMTIVHVFSCSGPSQEFGWAGHGSSAPLDIPNIFKVAGIDTKWDPESNKIFETGDMFKRLKLIYLYPFHL